MRYISPIRFYIHCGLDINDDAFSNPSRLKKLVTAEFAIAPEGIIDVEGHDYNKNDLLTDLESENWAQNIEYHKTIWNNKLLLEILEFENVKKPKSRPVWFNLSEDQEFVNFISPYFGEALNNIVRKYYQGTVNILEPRYWLTFLVFVKPEDEEMALSSTRNYLDSTISLFEKLNTANYTSYMPELKPWLTQSWQYLINELPESLFYYKDKIADVVASFIAQIYKYDLDIACKLNSRLVAVKGLNPELAEIIQQNYKVLSKASEQMTDAAYSSEEYHESGSGGRSVWGTIFTIIAAIFFLLKLFRLCSHM